MKNLIILFLLLSFSSISVPSLAQGGNRHPIGPHKNDAKRIDLAQGLERNPHLSLPKILLFQIGEKLQASVKDNDKEIIVQILDINRSVIYETTIDVLQNKWACDIGFLESNKKYIIKFLVPSEGYLIGSFYK